MDADSIRNEKEQRFNTVDGHVIHVHSGTNIIPIQKQLTRSASLLKNIIGMSTCAIY